MILWLVQPLLASGLGAAPVMLSLQCPEGCSGSVGSKTRRGGDRSLVFLSLCVFVCWEIPTDCLIVLLGGGSGKDNSQHGALVWTGLKWPSVAPPRFRHDHGVIYFWMARGTASDSRGEGKGNWCLRGMQKKQPDGKYGPGDA